MNGIVRTTGFWLIDPVPEPDRETPAYGVLVHMLLRERRSRWLTTLWYVAIGFAFIRLFGWWDIVPVWWLSAGLLARFALSQLGWGGCVLSGAVWGLICLPFWVLSRFGLDPAWATTLLWAVYAARLLWDFIPIAGVARAAQWSRGRVAMQIALDLERCVDLEQSRAFAEMAARLYLADGFPIPSSQARVYAGLLASYCGDISLAEEHFRAALEQLDATPQTCRGLEALTRAIAELNDQRARDVLGKSESRDDDPRFKSVRMVPLHLAIQWVFPIQRDLLYGIRELEASLLAIEARLGVAGPRPKNPSNFELYRWVASRGGEPGLDWQSRWHCRETRELWLALLSHRNVSPVAQWIMERALQASLKDRRPFRRFLQRKGWWVVLALMIGARTMQKLRGRCGWLLLAQPNLGTPGQAVRGLGPWTASVSVRDSLSGLLAGLSTFHSAEGLHRLVSWHAEAVNEGFLGCNHFIRGEVGGLDRHFARGAPHSLRNIPWTAFWIAEAARCLFIRESLRRIDHRSEIAATTSERWEATGPDPLRRLGTFAEGKEGEIPRAGGEPAPATRRIRGVSSPPTRNQVDELQLPEPPAGPGTLGWATSLLKPADLSRLLPDERTVLVVFHFVDDDLFILPIADRGPSSRVLDQEMRIWPGIRPRVLYPDTGLIQIPGARPILVGPTPEPRPIPDDPYATAAEPTGLVVRMLSATTGVRRLAERELVDPERERIRSEERGRLASCFRVLFDLLDLEGLLALLGEGPVREPDLHLVLIPAGPLAGIPLHAASDDQGRALYQRVASVRYGLSVHSLLELDRINRAAIPMAELRGVAFACPGDSDGQGFCHHIIPEVASLAGIEGWSDRWWIHAPGIPANEPDRATFRRRHASGNVLWMAAHGSYEDVQSPEVNKPGKRRSRPSLLLADGPVSDARLLTEGYDFRGLELLQLSCCLLGELKEFGASRRSSELEGFLTALVGLGCRRSVCAVWAVDDQATAAWAGCWARELRDLFADGYNRGPHGFPLAFKRSLEEFRHRFPDYDNEYYWSPFMLYGIG
jgi:hypothetical protein